MRSSWNDSRYLTDREKRREIEYLRACYQKGHLENVGGKGYIDLLFIPYLEQINARAGICTLQSCVGHELVDHRNGQKYVQSGDLWLRFSKDVSAKFHRRVEELLSQKGIEQVRVLYRKDKGHRHAREIIDIEFHGHTKFKHSIEPIVAFLYSISKPG